MITNQKISIKTKKEAEIKREIEKDIGSKIEKEKKKVKHKYGEYHHVLLTDEEYSRLCSDFGNITIERAIKVVDEYCQTSGKRYNDYNLVIRNWGIERAQKETARSGPMYSGWAIDDLEQRLIGG